MHRGVWLPGRGKRPFFPLCPCRTAGPTRPENSARLPPSRHAAYAPSGIIHLRSQHFASRLQDSYSNSLYAVRFVVLVVYDTVVLAGCRKTQQYVKCRVDSIASKLYEMLELAVIRSDMPEDRDVGSRCLDVREVPAVRSNECDDALNGWQPHVVQYYEPARGAQFRTQGEVGQR